MPVVSKEEIANARKMDLLSYLRAYEPGELVRFSGETYCTRTHDSVSYTHLDVYKRQVQHRLQ